MPVVLTRPAQDAQRWAGDLRDHGIPTVVLPLLAIAPAVDGAALERAADAAADYGALMFVSGNAVQGFFGARPRAVVKRAWAPGPGTRDALLAAGVSADRIDAPADDAGQFDSENLWRQVRGQLRAGDKLLLVRGGDAAGRSQGRDWLAQQLAADGVQVDKVVAYTRRPPAWTEAERKAARRAATDGSLWLFSSSEAAGNLPVLLPHQGWRQAKALCTHPRIAEAVRGLGFGAVAMCRPGLADVLASIESSR